jgi:hypothetical protein
MPTIQDHSFELNPMTGDEVLARLSPYGEMPATLASLIGLYEKDRECFFDLCSVGAGENSPGWVRELEALAVKLRSIVRNGFEIVTGTEEQLEIRSGSDSILVRDVPPKQVTDFLNELNGTNPGTASAAKYEGCRVSGGEVRFKLGSLGDQDRDFRVVSTWMKATPHVLQIDDQDRRAIMSGMPGYVVHGLLRCATKVVHAPTAVFEGIRREGGLERGRAYCGIPRRAYDSNGIAVERPDGFVYVVYADRDGFVFDWDWVPEDPHKPGYPAQWNDRFSRELDTLVETSFGSLADVSPAEFTRDRAWYSRRGDCAFYYSSDQLAYAERVNEDLTVFKAFDSGEVLGCKLKNITGIVARILAEGAMILEKGMHFKNILANSLIRHMEVQRSSKKHYLAYRDVFASLEGINPEVRSASTLFYGHSFRWPQDPFTDSEDCAATAVDSSL